MIIYKADELKKNKIFDLNEEYIRLLSLLEKINPCNQFYEATEDCLIISYELKLNLFNFINLLPLKAKAQIIGLPISVSQRGYYGDLNKTIGIIKKRKGLKIILNADEEIIKNARTLSTFVFENSFETFDDYLNKLRSSYRRRINKALECRSNIIINKIKNNEFSEKHYDLYLSIMNRTDNPLETLPIEFFKNYDSEIYEFLNKGTLNVIGFVQLKEFDGRLCFLFGGFNKEDVKKYDLYFNMLLKIIETGIEKKTHIIEFGQTAEESKLKIGCKEVYKYLYVHHSNSILNFIIQKLLPFMSYRPHWTVHHVFKE
jgi:hypothetical protein